MLVEYVIEHHFYSDIYNLPNAYCRLLKKYFILRIKVNHTMGVVFPLEVCQNKLNTISLTL